MTVANKIGNSIFPADLVPLRYNALELQFLSVTVSSTAKRTLIDFVPLLTLPNFQDLTHLHYFMYLTNIGKEDF